MPPGRPWIDGLHQPGQLAAALDGRAAALGDDATGDGARATLLAVAIDQVGQVGLVQRVDQLGGGLPARGVEAHIERGIGGEAEAAPTVGELIRGEAEVEQDAVHRGEVRRAGEFGQRGEVALRQHEASGGHRFGEALARAV